MNASAAIPPEPGLSARSLWTLVLASLGVFLASLDVVVVAMALPAIRSRLNASLAELDWTLNAYTLAFACLMLTGAAVGDRFGRRRTYLAGVAVFTAGSALAATATGAGLLITGRLVQGIGAALLAPLTLTIIVEAFPARLRAGAIGVWAGIAGFGVAAGPLVGGLIVEGFAWQTIFWLNVPVGLLIIVLTLRYVDESHGQRHRFDLTGVLLAASGLLGLSWGLTRAAEAGWSSAEVAGALLAGALLLALFLAWEGRTPEAMLPLRYFPLRGFATGNAASFCQYFSLTASLFMIAQLLQLGLGYRPLVAGLCMLPWNCTPMLVSPLAGPLTRWLGNRPLIVGGLALQAVGVGWLAVVTRAGVGYPALVGPLILAGLGLSVGLPAIANTVTAAVPPAGTGIAAGTQQTIAQVGGLFGVAVVSIVFAGSGGYGSPGDFVDGFRAAIWVAALVPLAGAGVALLSPSTAPEPAAVQAGRGADRIARTETLAREE